MMVMTFMIKEKLVIIIAIEKIENNFSIKILNIFIKKIMNSKRLQCNRKEDLVIRNNI